MARFLEVLESGFLKGISDTPTIIDIDDIRSAQQIIDPNSNKEAVAVGFKGDQVSMILLKPSWDELRRMLLRTEGET